MRFNWLSFVLGFLAATLVLTVWQGFLYRLRWRMLTTSLKQYAKNLAHTERVK